MLVIRSIIHKMNIAYTAATTKLSEILFLFEEIVGKHLVCIEYITEKPKMLSNQTIQPDSKLQNFYLRKPLVSYYSEHSFHIKTFKHK